MECLVKEFLDYLKHELWYSDNTVHGYRRDIKHLMMFLCQNSITDFNDVTDQHFVKLIEKLHERLSSASICRAIYAFKKLFSYLHREGHTQQNPSLRLYIPSLWKKIPTWLTLHEVISLIEAPNTETKKGLRDRAILELLYGSGIRVTELCHLLIGDFNLSEMSLRVKGKGSKQRIVIINKHCVEALTSYWKSRSKRYQKPYQLAFITTNNKFLDRIAVWRIIKKYAKIANINKNISPHTLRHTYATHMYHGGASIRIIQELLGHSSIETTSIYLHTCPDHLKREFMNCHLRN